MAKNDADSRATTGEPKLISSGTYALYETDRGGYHLTYHAEGTEQAAHIDVPAQLVRMASTMGGLSPIQMMSRLRGIKG